MTTYLYETETFTFALPTTTMPDCGPWSFRLIAENGQTYLQNVITMIERPAQGDDYLGYFTFSPVLKNPWLLQQPFSIRVEATHG